MAAGKSECWTVVLPMVLVIWQDPKNVRVGSTMKYGSVIPLVMVSQYLWVTLQAHIGMNYFLHNQFIQHPELALHITINLF